MIVPIALYERRPTKNNQSSSRSNTMEAFNEKSKTCVLLSSQLLQFYPSSVDGKHFIRRFQTSPFSNLSGLMWTGPKTNNISKNNKHFDKQCKVC